MELENLNQHLLSKEASESFKISAGLLDKLFNKDSIREKKSKEVIDQMFGGVQNLIKTLESSEEAGIIEASVPRRHNQFGKNALLIKNSSIFCEFFENLTLRILIVALFFSLSKGIYLTIKKGNPEYYEGLGILVGIIITLIIPFLVASINYSPKESKVRSIKVVRDNDERIISVFDLVVGDIAKIKTGDVMPVDALVLWSNDLSADESKVTGESGNQKKNANESPFLLFESQITQGEATVLVLTVGNRTFSEKNTQQNLTLLQKKINNIADLIGKIGILVAIIIFVIIMTQKLILASEIWEIQETLDAIIDPLIIALIIIVVTLPEGLPLIAVLSLAFSVNQMLKENNLVKKLETLETMGQITTICTDGTQTLTMNVLTVKAVCIGKADGMLESPDKSKICNEVLGYLRLHICYNTDQSITDAALLKSAKSWGWDSETPKNQSNIKIQIPFNSSLKRMTTVVEEGDNVYVFIKGSSEIILNICSKHINLSGHTHTLDENEKQEIKEKVINLYAQRAYRTVGLAYKIVKKRDWNKFINEDGTYKIDKLENKMILLGIFGFQDSVKSEVPDTIRKFQHAGITVRMITGDNKDTALAIAKDSGILSNSYKPEDGDDIVLTGNELRARVGRGLVPDNSNSKEMVVQNLEEFSRIIKKLRVLCRASPEDKLVLVTGLRQLNEVVAVVGDGTNDAPALIKANVGFCMGITGTDLAREASDIILLDDRFSSIVAALLGGRNIYEGIGKFIQFQFTVNIVALTVCFVGSIVGGDSPITVIQLLWVNLIIDIFAVLAFANEPLNATLLDRQPIKHDNSLLNPDIIKAIIGQIIYQLSWLFFILYGMSNFTEGLFQSIYIDCYAPEDNSEPVVADTNSTETDQSVALSSGKIFGCYDYTLFFHTFVMMQVFNEINCRKLKSSEFNVFRGFLNNSVFLIVIVVTIVVQILIVQFGGLFFQTTALTLYQHLFALGVGVGALLWGILFKLVPIQIFACFDFHQGEKNKSAFLTWPSKNLKKD